MVVSDIYEFGLANFDIYRGFRKLRATENPVELGCSSLSFFATIVFIYSHIRSPRSRDRHAPLTESWEQVTTAGDSAMVRRSVVRSSCLKANVS